MNPIDIILWPFKWIVSAVLWVFHSLFTAIGMDPASGWTWVLAIVFMTFVMRILTVPLFLKQIKSMRGMQELQPEMAKIQAKYKGKKDQLSRQAMAQEQMALYKSKGANPLSSCFPIIVQMPVFFGLLQVLRGVPAASGNHEGILVLSADMVHQFNDAFILGAPLFSTLTHPGNGNHTSTIALAIIMIVAMSLSQFITQRQLTAKNMSAQAKESPMYRQQQMLMYLFPIIFAVGGINFPLGVLVYWTVSNFWAMGQQWWVIRNNPTAGSQAEKELNERRAAKGLPPVGKSREEHEAELEAQRERAQGGQRNQPVSRNRQKKKKKN